MSKKVRILTENDVKAWEEAVRGTTKTKRPTKLTHDHKAKKTPLTKHIDIGFTHKTVDKQFAAIKVNKELQLGETEGLDAKTAKKMDQGRIKIEGVLDLHRCTSDIAFNKLAEFIKQAYHRSQRMLLVITGKGKNSPNSRSILSKSLPSWLNHPLIRDKVIRFTYASRKNGGNGAFYILIKRRKI